MIKTPPKTHLPKTYHIQDPKPNFRISLPDPSLKSHQTTTTATKTQKCYFPFLAGNQSDRQARATWVNHLLDGCNARMDIILWYVIVLYSVLQPFSSETCNFFWFYITLKRHHFTGAVQIVPKIKFKILTKMDELPIKTVTLIIV